MKLSWIKSLHAENQMIDNTLVENTFMSVNEPSTADNSFYMQHFFVFFHDFLFPVAFSE